ncbi:MAG: PAS domain S-box protein, partial [Flavobacteriales bacterium]|nr:PAS domain S-box protein [Flavobacteriales bacterium]
MNSLTVVLFLMSELGLAIYMFQSKFKRFPTRALQLISGTIFLLAASKITDIFGWTNFQFDQVLFYRELQEEEIKNQMAPNTALGFLLGSMAIFFQIEENNRIRRDVGTYISFALFFVGLLPLIGYLYKVSALFTVSYYIPLAFPTAISFLFLAMGLLLVNKPIGIIAQFNTDLYGGTWARKMMPYVIIGPVLIGGLRMLSHHYHWVSVELGISLLMTTMLFFFFGVMLFTMVILNRYDREKRHSQQELRDLNNNLEKLVEKRTQQLLRADKMFRILVEKSGNGLDLISPNMELIYMSPGSQKIHGYSKEEVNRIGIPNLIPEDKLDVLRIQFEQAMANPGVPIPGGGLMKHKSGKWIHVESTLTNYLHEPEINALVYSFQDVTEREENILRIKKSERIYHS